MTEKELRVGRFTDLGFGLVLHWGLYSFYESGEWVEFAHDLDRDDYRKRMDEFDASSFNAKQISSLARNCGAGFIILITRHHDGFSLYDTRGLNDFDAPHSPAGRDLVNEFVNACRDEGIMPILYHTTLDWQWNGKTTWELGADEFNDYLDYLHDSLRLLCSNYGKIGGFIFDGNWCRPEMDWKYDRLYGMIREYQPEALIMDNTGLERPGELDHPEIDAVTFEQQAVTEKGVAYGEKIAAMRWLTMNDHWGWSPKDFNFKSGRELLEGLVQSRRYGAVYTMNLAPLADGRINDMDLAVLGIIGRWMSLYGKAVRKPRPANIECFGRDFLLDDIDAQKSYYFCFDLGIAGHDNVTRDKEGVSVRRILGWKRNIRSLRWMDNYEELEWRVSGDNLIIDCTGFPYGENHVIRVGVITW